MSRFHSQGKRRRQRKDREKTARRLETPVIEVGWRQIPGDLRRWNRLIGAHRTAITRKLAIAAGTLIAAFVIGLLLAPLMVEFVIKGRTAAARVNGAGISLTEFARTRDFTRYRAIADLNALSAYRAVLSAGTDTTPALIDQVIQDRRIDLLSVDFTTIDDIVAGRLLRAQAAADGYVIPPADLDAEREAQLSSPAPPSTSVGAPAVPGDPRPLPERVDEMLANLGLDRDIFENIVAGAVLDDHYADRARAEVPDSLRQGHLRFIVAPTLESAESVVARYRAGERWDDLAWELSTPARDLVDGGDLGFVPVDLFDPRYADAAAGLTPGEVSEPVAVIGEYYVLLAVEWQEDRSLTPEQLEQLREQAAEEQRSQLFEAAEIEYLLDTDAVEWAERHGLRNVGELDAAIAAPPF